MGVKQKRGFLTNEGCTTANNQRRLNVYGKVTWWEQCVEISETVDKVRPVLQDVQWKVISSKRVDQYILNPP